MRIKENTIKQFGKQADAYSKGFIFQDPFHLSEIIERSGVTKNDHVLDIATGSGFLALEFAKKAGIIIGIDITRTILVYAQKRQKDLELNNTGFLLSDVESLPFPEKTFDIVSCRFAFHHFPDPHTALREMKRVCRGCIVLVDGTSSEDYAKSFLHNRIEKIRDPSHVRIYSLSEMKKMLSEIGAEITDVVHWDIPQDFDEWMKRAGTDEKKTNSIKHLMINSVVNDSTGLRVITKESGLGFTYDTVILIGDVGSSTGIRKEEKANSNQEHSTPS